MRRRAGRTPLLPPAPETNYRQASDREGVAHILYLALSCHHGLPCWTACRLASQSHQFQASAALRPRTPCTSPPADSEEGQKQAGMEPRTGSLIRSVEEGSTENSRLWGRRAGCVRAGGVVLVQSSDSTCLLVPHPAPQRAGDCSITVRSETSQEAGSLHCSLGRYPRRNQLAGSSPVEQNDPGLDQKEKKRLGERPTAIRYSVRRDESSGVCWRGLVRPGTGS